MSVATVTSPFEVSLSAFDVVDVNAVRFDPSALSVVLRDAAGEATTSAALAATLHGFLVDGMRAATLFVVGEVTARLRVKPGSSGGGGGGGQCEDDNGDCSSSSISISAWSSGAPGSTDSSCSSSTAGIPEPTGGAGVVDDAADAVDVGTGQCAKPPACDADPYADPYANNNDDAGADADASGSSSGESSSDRRMRFERLGYGVPDADRAADEFARDGAPSCRLYVAQRGHIIASSPDVASYEPVFLTEAEVSPTQSVTMLIVLGGNALDSRDLLPPRRRFKGTILEATIQPNHFNDDEEKTVTLFQTHPLVDAIWNSACVRIRVSHPDAFCANLHVIGASGLPRRGVAHEVFRHLAPVFALVMQTNVEMTAAARALTDQWTEHKRIEAELRSQAMNPSLSAFIANRSQNAVVNVTLAAADFIFPEALELSKDTLEAIAARRSDCSRSTSEPSGDRSDGAGQSDHGNLGGGAVCSRSTSSESGNASESGGDSGGSSAGHCSRSTSSSSGASDASGPSATSSSAHPSSSGCSRSTSEGGGSAA